MTADASAEAAYEAGIASVAASPPPPLTGAQAADLRPRLRRTPDPEAAGKEGGEAA